MPPKGSFSRRCPRCASREVYMIMMDYPAEVKWDGQLYKFTVVDLELPACQACGELVFTIKVDNQIQECLETLLSTTLPNKH
jgi:hypothetical protein